MVQIILFFFAENHGSMHILGLELAIFLGIACYLIVYRVMGIMRTGKWHPLCFFLTFLLMYNIAVFACK